jgi:dienelactone hydrolase
MERYAPYPMTGFTIHPVSFLLRPGFGISAALYIPDAMSGAGVLVAHGHFGEGKSSAEAQEISHRLASSGVLVLAVDTPGVEERERPGTVIHEEGGAHNRGWLTAAGSHALALQLTVLRRALDLLEAEGASRIAATGASGGAVQSFYLSLVDSRVRALALASTPRIPREARAGGCPCDQIPGHPGPDPGTLAHLSVPSLWLSEVPQARPEGLPESASFEVVPGPHGFAPQMQTMALGFLASHLDFSVAPWQSGDLDLVDLRTPGTLGNTLDIMQLPIRPEQSWKPSPWSSVPYELDCSGTGPAVAVAGGTETDQRALLMAGLRPCMVDLPLDELGDEEALGQGRVYADRQAGGLRAAAEKMEARAVWAVRAWALPASALNLPYVIRDPIVDLSSIQPERDPAWIHVPGAWWGVSQAVVDGAQMSSADPTMLAQELARSLGVSGLASELPKGTGGSAGQDQDDGEPVQGTGQ